MAFSSSDIPEFTEFEKRGWEQAADAYHDHWGALSSQSAMAMLRAARVKAGVRVLDVATGAGYVAAAVCKLGAKSVGLDFSRAQIDLAQRVHPKIDFCHGNAQNLPFEDESFDAVVMGFGMNHLPEPDRATAEA